MNKKNFKLNKLKQIFIIFALLLFFPIVSAKPAEPVVVSVGIYVLNLGKFDVSTGSYTVDFYLDFICNEPCSPEKFEFMNGRATSIDKLIDEPKEKFYRIQAALSQNIDLRQYPFDKHSLTIKIEDKEKTTDQLVYKFDEKNSGIDPSVIIVGWQLDGWDAKVEEHHYPNYEETFSNFVFNINISRVVLTSLFKSFLPVFFMVFVAMLTLVLTADKVTTRLSLNISTLLASVMFHLNSTSSIPPVGYLTFADKFMITTYVILVTVLFSGILLMRNTEKKDEAKAYKIYRYSLISIPILTILSYGIIFLFL
jgi:hypothetical protein